MFSRTQLKFFIVFSSSYLNAQYTIMHENNKTYFDVFHILWHLPVLQLGLSLYFCDIHTSTTAAFSTASAIASKVDPART